MRELCGDNCNGAENDTRLQSVAAECRGDTSGCNEKAATALWPRALDKCYQCYHFSLMTQLLVRNVADSVARRLKERATAHGVSVEEEHRRILREAVSRPPRRKPSLIEFLSDPAQAVAPEVELDLGRRRVAEERDTGM
jgi:plasmid stability protein